jgi:hypothetical protein
VVVVEVIHYENQPPERRFRPEVTIGGITFLPDGREYGWDVYSCMSKDRANEIAKKVARELGVEPILHE